MRKNILATVILLVLDFIWIGFFMGGRYRSLVQKIQRSPLVPNLFSAIIAYTLMALGLNLFVLPNIRKGKELQDSLYYGGFFGLIVYGIYDFTNDAVFKDWDFQLAVIDIIWGIFVYSAAAYLGTSL